MTHASSLIRLMDTARLHLPSALEGTLRLELFNVIKEFMQRTNIWQDELDISVVPGTYDYPLSANQGGTFINRLLWLEGARSDTGVPESGPRRDGVLLTPGVGAETLRIAATPSTAETWYAHVALAISDPTDSDGVPFMPDWIMDKYHATLLEGLLERMMAQPAKPYSNVQGVALHGRRFKLGIATARTEAMHKFTYGSNSWSFPRSFRSDSQRF